MALVDGLEARGWIERRRSAGDRRAHALHLTPAGRELLDRIMAVSAEHEAELMSGLDSGQRSAVSELLLRLATTQGLVTGLHPGFADADADQTLQKPPARTRTIADDLNR